MNLSSNIQDVNVIALKKVVNERGYLQEVQRNDAPEYLGIGQIYITQTRPGVVKAWYRHHDQIDQIALIAGELLLVLYDTRPESSTRELLQKIKMTESAPLLVQIPTGVWHGFKALGAQSASLLHLNTHCYNEDKHDEDRIPPDDSSIPFQWGT